MTGLLVKLPQTRANVDQQAKDTFKHTSIIFSHPWQTHTWRSHARLDSSHWESLAAAIPSVPFLCVRPGPEVLSLSSCASLQIHHDSHAHTHTNTRTFAASCFAFLPSYTDMWQLQRCSAINYNWWWFFLLLACCFGLSIPCIFGCGAAETSLSLVLLYNRHIANKMVWFRAAVSPLVILLQNVHALASERHS